MAHRHRYDTVAGTGGSRRRCGCGKTRKRAEPCPAPVGLAAADLIRRLGDTIGPLVDARDSSGAVLINVRPGAMLTLGQLAEAISATDGIHIERTYAADPPVFRVVTDN